MTKFIDTIPVCDIYTEDKWRAWVEGAFTTYGKKYLAEHYGSWEKAEKAGWYVYTCGMGVMFMNSRDHNVQLAAY